MKPWIFLGILVPVGLVFDSCKSPVYVEKDHSVNLGNYHTYTWVDTRANDHDDSKRPTAYADLSVRNAVNEQLSKKGWKEVTDDPDALLSYDVFVKRSVQEQTNPVYTQPFTRMVYNPYRRHWTTIYYPSQFAGYETYQQPVREGTITITLTDAKTDKTVWQAWTTDKLNYARLTPTEINKSVKNIFRKF